MSLILRRYLPLLILLGAAWVLSLGPGLYAPLTPPSDLGDVRRGLTEVGASQPYHWNYVVFSAVCHSKPERSFSLGGVQMAVNSRCSGFFTGLLLAAMILPLLIRLAVADLLLYRKKWVLYALGCLLALQGLDVAGNMAGIWTNSLWSRFWLGCTAGVALLLSISEAFVRPDAIRSGLPGRDRSPG